MNATTRSGPRGPYAKTVERRAQIAQVALDYIRQHGHRDLTTAEIARRAGVGERSLFRYFPTRDHLLVAAFELAEQGNAVMLGQDTSKLADVNDIAAVMATINAAEEWRMNLMVALSAMAQYPDHPAHAYFRHHYALVVAAFADILRQRQEQGLAHPDQDPESMARRLAAIWDGLQSQWVVTRDFDLVEEIRAAFRQLTGQNVMEAKQAIDQALAGA